MIEESSELGVVLIQHKEIYTSTVHSPKK